MKRIDDPFISIFPSIDLHGFDRVTARIKTEEFINDNLKLKNYKVIVIHGIGTGSLKEEVHNFLRSNKSVLSFKLDNQNNGVTIVDLKEQSMKNKKGFTLTELLAVIALIGIIMLLIVPNVLGTFNSASKQLFYDEVLSLYNNAYTTYIYRSSEGDYTKTFCVGKDGNKNPMDVEEKENFYYNVTVDEYGNVLSLQVSNDKYGINLSDASGLKKKDVKLSKVGDPMEVTCGAGAVLPEDDKLVCIITDTKRECRLFDFSYEVPNEKA